MVGQAGDVDEALERTRAPTPRRSSCSTSTCPAGRACPRSPTCSRRAPGAAVVVMTQHDDPEFARTALRGGASGFVLKEAADNELVDAVRAAAAGRTYVNPALGARLAHPIAPDPGSDELPVGSTFAGHRIDAVAGRGGMGVVYRATDLTLDRPVALKVLAPRARARSRLPRPLRARVPARGRARPPAHRPDLPRRHRARRALPHDALHRGHRPARRCSRRRRGSSRPARSGSSPRSPAR